MIIPYIKNLFIRDRLTTSYYYVGEQGLGDRLESIGTMLALRHIGINIKVFWSETSEHFPASFGELFLPFPGLTSIDHNSNPMNENFVQLERFRPTFFALFKKSFLKRLYKLHYPPEIIDAIEHYGEIRFRNLCIHLVRQIKPVPWIEKAVDSFQEKHFSERMVGIHIRRTDKESVICKGFNGGISKHKKLIEEMKHELRHLIKKGNKIFICSDNRDSIKEYKEIIKHFGGNVIYYKKQYNPLQFRHTSSADALIDMLLLSRCSVTLGTQSSFRFVASYILSRNSLYWNGTNIDIRRSFKNKKYISSYNELF